jgi:purine-nucleoside phosphorylase
VTVHLEAKPGEIAETVLLPGDPLRAQAIADKLDDVVCTNRVRGMLGFTGSFEGVPVSVQGTGMGLPSLSIYAHELMVDYGVKRLIRVGTCGAMQPHLALGDIILAMTASTDSNLNRRQMDGLDFAPCASFPLLQAAVAEAAAQQLTVHVGAVFSSDVFYDDHESWKTLAAYGTLAEEMETSALYTLAAKQGAQALAILTVSDLIATGEALSSADRQQRCTPMMDIALRVAVGAG